MRRAAVVLVIVVAGCTSDRTTPRAVPTDGPFPSPPTALVYVDGTQLRSYDLASGAAELIARLPSADVALAPDGSHYAFVEETDPRGPGPEGFRAPQVLLAGAEEGVAPTILGAGRAPEWSADSTRLSVITPTERGETISIYDVAAQQMTTAAPGDELWTIVGWTNRGIVAIGSSSGAVLVPADGSPVEPLGREPAELWGVSPIDDRFLIVGASGAAIARSGQPRSIDVDAALGDGAWAFDGRTIAVTLIEAPSTSLALIDAVSGHAREVAGSRGAQGNVVWALDGKTFAFVRVDPTRRARLQAVVCTTSTECSTAFSWDDGVRLLGFR